MGPQILHWNLILAWLWILLGFLSGFVMGLGFHDEKWLGGYASHKRRLYRLGHISFFGLALMNLMFYFTARDWSNFSTCASIASGGFLLGAVTMPLCCLIMAHHPKLRAIFAIPVINLVGAGVLTLWEVVKL